MDVCREVFCKEGLQYLIVGPPDVSGHLFCDFWFCITTRKWISIATLIVLEVESVCIQMNPKQQTVLAVQRRIKYDYTYIETKVYIYIQLCII